MNEDKDVTDQVEFNLNDDECLPLTKCVCGVEFESWNFILGVYKDDPKECPNCKRKLYFKPSIRVYEIEEKRRDND